MNPFVELLLKPEFRAFASFPFRSMGFSNFAKSFLKARKLNDGPGKVLPRYLLPELWKNLGDRKAVVTSTGVVTFEELSERSVRLANSFYQQGLRENDRVAVLLKNEQAWFDVMLACGLSGLRMPMLNTHLKPEELAKCINACMPKILVFSDLYLEIIKSIEHQLTGVKILVCSASESEVELPPHYFYLDKLIAKGENHLEPGGFGFPQMAFSGGSTGVPKFIMEGGAGENSSSIDRRKGVSDKELKQIKAKFAYGVSQISVGPIKGQIVSLIPGPLYHAGTQVAVFPIYFGGTVVPMLKYDAEEFLRLIEKEKVNFTFVAPTMLERVLKLPEAIKNKYDLSSMQIIYCAAAPCADYVKKGINELFVKQGASKNVFHEYYGSSEAACISVLLPQHYEEKPERYKSVGKVMGCDCMVYNPEQQRECAPNEDGHVIIRSARMYTLNYGNSSEMDNAFIEVNGSLWFDDGCVGHLDEDGFLYLTSRSKDMIISGGVNIFPVEIEEVIRKHPNILDVAVVKVPDKDLGEVAGALVQTLDGNKIPEQELIAYCKQAGLYGFKLPKYIKHIKELPKNTAGKIRKVDLEGEFENPEPVALN